MSAVAMALTILNATAWLLPDPAADKSGWGLRLCGLTVQGPYLVGEYISDIRFDVVLVNRSKEMREYDPFVEARRYGAIELDIVQPEGKPFPSSFPPHPQRNPFTQPSKLAAGQYASHDFRFGNFGFDRVREPGRYRMELSWKIDGKTVKAPPVEFEVADTTSETVLANHKVHLEGYRLKVPANEQDRPVVQQVKVGNRTLLIYRRFAGPRWGGGIEATYRLAELPGKCEMKVDGGFGARNPLTITYKIAPTAEPTKLVISSDDGRPWTEEQERLRQERLKREAAKSPPDVPAPKPAKPQPLARRPSNPSRAGA